MLDSDFNIVKYQFALEYLKNGRNAAKAADAVGVGRRRGEQWISKKDPEKGDKQVYQYIKEAIALVESSQSVRDITKKIFKSVASLDEVLSTASMILRGERKDETVVVVKDTDIDDDGMRVYVEKPVVVEVATKNSDILAAAKLLLQFYKDKNANNAGTANKGGVIILPEVR